MMSVCGSIGAGCRDRTASTPDVCGSAIGKGGSVPMTLSFILVIDFLNIAIIQCSFYLKYGYLLAQRRKGRKEIQIL
jgi:hypothetical protein